MNTHLRRLSVPAALLAGLLALSGCAVVDELAYKQRSLEFDTQAEMIGDDAHEITWVPEDGRAITIVESTVATDAALLVTSSAPLDAAECAPGERLSAPSYSVAGAPDVYEISEAYVCGAWTVVAADGGWFGWTPNSPAERGE